MSNPIKKHILLNKRTENRNKNKISKLRNNDKNNSSNNKIKSKRKHLIPDKNKTIKSENKINVPESELNFIEYSEAKKIDKRTYLEYYFSLVKTRHPLISSFLPNTDYNSRAIKICLFFFSFASAFIINSLFFTDETMHKILEDEGIFNIVYNLPKIIYSTLISTVINIIIKMLALSQDSILAIKKEKQEKNLKNEKLRDKVSKTKKI